MLMIPNCNLQNKPQPFTPSSEFGNPSQHQQIIQLSGSQIVGKKFQTSDNLSSRMGNSYSSQISQSYQTDQTSSFLPEFNRQLHFSSFDNQQPVLQNQQISLQNFDEVQKNSIVSLNQNQQQKSQQLSKLQENYAGYKVLEKIKPGENSSVEFISKQQQLLQSQFSYIYNIPVQKGEQRNIDINKHPLQVQIPQCHEQLSALQQSEQQNKTKIFASKMTIQKEDVIPKQVQWKLIKQNPVPFQLKKEEIQQYTPADSSRNTILLKKSIYKNKQQQCSKQQYNENSSSLKSENSRSPKRGMEEGQEMSEDSSSSDAENFDEKKQHYKKTATKNVPKNYGNALVNYIENSHKSYCKKMLKENNLRYPEFKKYLQPLKTKANIKIMRQSLLNDESLSQKKQFFNKLIRILFFKFLRQEAVVYFFNNHKILRSKQMRQSRQLFMLYVRQPESLVGIKIKPVYV